MDFRNRTPTFGTNWTFGAKPVKGLSGLLGGEQEPFYTDDFGHEYFEGPGQYLARLVTRELKVRVRFEKPGTLQRSLMACESRADAREAYMVGREAVSYALEGHSDCMVTLEREPGTKYRCTTSLAPLEAVAGRVKAMPLEYLDTSTGFPGKEYLNYARPLVGRLPRYARFQSATRYTRHPGG